MKRRSVRLRDDRQKPERRQHGETTRWCPHVVMAENLFNLCSHLLDLHFGLNSGLVGLKCCRSRLQLVTGLWLWTDRNKSFIQLLWKKKTQNWNTPAEASDRKEKSVSKSHIFGGFAPLTESSIAPEDVFLMFKVFVRGTVKIREVKLHSSVQQPYKPACRIQGPWNVPRCLSSISRRDQVEIRWPQGSNHRKEVLLLVKVIGAASERSVSVTESSHRWSVALKRSQSCR